MRPGRVLVVDDLERWRNAVSKILRSGGFDVDTAATRQEAAEKLKSRLYHALVLDIRMEEADKANQEGMDLFRELRQFENSNAMAVIVLSAHGTRSQMREAFRQLNATDFIDKKGFDGIEFLAEVRDLFDNRLEINLGLEIHWLAGGSAEAAVLNLNLDGTRVKRDTDLQRLVSGELDDLLCRLFHSGESILVRPFGAGLSGTGVLWVQPFYGDGGGRAVVVKFGDIRRIEGEIHNFTHFVQPYIGGGRSTAIQAWRRTPRLGGILYTLLGGAGDLFEDFGAFYRRSELPAIRQVLDHLFLDTCGGWYANPGQLRPLDLTSYYTERFGLKVEALQQKVAEGLKTVQGKDRLYFSSLSGERTFRNPIPAFAERHLVMPTYETLTHGDFNDQNILLDSEGRSWLIDFQGTGPGHVLRDLVHLDTVVRLRLLQPEEATLDERLLLEETLCQPGDFSQFASLEPPAGASPALSKAFGACVHLRSLAGRLVPGYSRGDASEYYAGNLYCALNLVRFLSIPNLQREHALLSASLIAERLKL